MMTDADLDARPKLRQDVAFFRTRDGALLRGVTEAFQLEGPSAYRMLTRLGPYLNGERTLREICAGLDESRRRQVVAVVGSLMSCGVVVNAARWNTEPDVRARFLPQLEFLEHLGTGAAERFARFRSARVLLTGAGETLFAAADGLLRNGASRLDIAPDTWGTAERRRLDRMLLHIRIPPARVNVNPRLPPAGHDLVLFCADRGGLRQLLLLNERCHRDGPTLIPLVSIGEFGMIGPVVRPGTSGCWLCAQLRLAGTLPPGLAVDTWRELALGAPAGAAAAAFKTTFRMLGGALAFEAFRVLTGALDADTDGAVVTQELRTLESTRERLLPHPGCPVCADAAGTAPIGTAAVTAAPPDREPPGGRTPPDEHGRLEQLQMLIGKQVGVFTRSGDEQPRWTTAVWSARLRLPATAQGAGFRDITAFHNLTGAAASVRVVLAAAREYVGRLGRHPGTVTGRPAELITQGRRPVTVEQLTTWSAPGRSSVGSWVPARELAGDGEWLVPSAAAYPTSAANLDRLVEPTTAGSAAEFSLDQVVADGLSSLLAYGALRDLARGTATVIEVPGHAVPLRRELPASLRVYELPGAAPAHALLAVVAGPHGRLLWTVGHALDGQVALTNAACDLIGRLDADAAGSGAVDLGMDLLTDLHLPAQIARDGGPSRLREPPSSTMDILHLLRSTGRTPLLVDTTTTDLAAAGLVTGTVLIVDPRTKSGHGSRQKRDHT